MLYGLDLFSGIGGNSLALGSRVNVVAYCEQDRYAQAVLLSRMSEGLLPRRPIWDDVRTLRGDLLPQIDIIIAGFPCQDISVAGRGAGLEGERSGLFFEVVRLAQETKSPFLFLENVPAIRTRGLDTVVRTLSGIGYDCRWGMLSAYDVGAPHLRERWFLLAYSRGYAEFHAGNETKAVESQRDARLVAFSRSTRQSEPCAVSPLADSASLGWSKGRTESEIWRGRNDLAGGGPALPDGMREGRQGHRGECELGRAGGEGEISRGSAWELEPNVGRVVNGLPFRVDRIKCLGNAVVPAQAREAFERLMGIKRLE